MTTEEELFLQQILEDRDRLFRETSKLRTQLSGYENFASERTSYKQQIDEKDKAIGSLKIRVEELLRKIWGKSSERYIKEDPQQRCLDFDGLDLLPEEKKLATSAKEEIEYYKKKRVLVRKREYPVRKPLPENLPRKEYHIYPEHIDIEKWTELKPEITEVLEQEPTRWYVRRIIRHKYALKNKNIDDENAISVGLGKASVVILRATLAWGAEIAE